jgi:protein-glutamine gamma-glutamyltransferase
MTPLDWLAVAAAFTAEQLVDVPADASAWWAVLGGGGWTLWAIVLRQAGARLSSGRSGRPRGAAVMGIASMAAVPPLAIVAVLAWQGLPTACGSAGASPEAIMLAGLRSVLCVMLAVGTTEGETRFAMATTLFVMVLAALVNDHPATAMINAGYAAVAAAGLAARVSRATVRGAAANLPSPAGLASCLAVAATVAWLGGHRDVCGRALVGWMPLSGGDSRAFPWARDGVGDGENIVAAKEKPQATAPVKSGIFATSHRPSLYDLFSDLYGEPPKPTTGRQRSFGVGLQDRPPPDEHLADSEHAGREFSTVRKARPGTRRPTNDLAARAVVSLAGPTPAHLRLAVYDTFDGRTWRTDSPPITASMGSRLEHAGGDWMRWQDQDPGPPPAREADDEHALTIGTLRTSVLPLAARADAFRIDKIDRPDFFRTPAEDVVTLDGVEAPAGSIVHVRSLAGGVDATGVIAVTAPPAVAAVPRGEAVAWVGDVLDAWEIDRDAATLGWPHVARVVAELQARIVRDDAASPPDDCPDTLEHVLTVSHRGRSYDFAGAAAILLRECGYATRLVGGLHVSGERRDVRSRRVIATAADAHVWVEVRDATGRWIPLEPTPGYRLRPPTVPWTIRVLDGLTAAAAWARAHAGVIAMTFGVMLLAGASVLCGWRWCLDALATAWWRRAVERGTACPMQATWQLLTWRARLAGCPRRFHETARDWHRRTLEPAALGHATMPFLSCLERAAYGPPTTPGDRVRHRDVATSAASLVTVARLRGREEHRVRRFAQAFIQEAPRWHLS